MEQLGGGNRLPEFCSRSSAIMPWIIKFNEMKQKIALIVDFIVKILSEHIYHRSILRTYIYTHIYIIAFITGDVINRTWGIGRREVKYSFDLK